MVKYEAVQEQEQLRQRYLDRLVIPHISKVIYDPTYEETQKRFSELCGRRILPPSEVENATIFAQERMFYSYMNLVGGWEMLGRDNTNPIFVYPDSFSEFEETDFLDVLLNHEGFHAQDYALGIPFRDGVLDHRCIPESAGETVEILIEIRAYWNQIKNIPPSLQRMYQECAESLQEEWQNLCGRKPSTPFEEEVINYCKEEYEQMVVKVARSIRPRRYRSISHGNL